jgi:Ca2+-dependent lipid-binding protein
VKVTVVQGKDVPFVDQLLGAVDPYCRLCFKGKVLNTEVQSGQTPVWNESFNFVFEVPKDERQLHIWMGDADDDDDSNGSGPPSHVIAEVDVELPTEEGTLERKYDMISGQGKDGVGMLAAPSLILKFETKVEALAPSARK